MQDVLTAAATHIQKDFVQTRQMYKIDGVTSLRHALESSIIFVWFRSAKHAEQSELRKKVGKGVRSYKS